MNRTVTVKVSELIEKIKENRIKHIKEYELAVKAYKITALKKLEELKDSVENGDMTAYLSLTTPMDNSKMYNELLTQFEMEVEEVIKLNQNDYIEIVHDRTTWAIAGGTSNSIYSSSIIGG